MSVPNDEDSVTPDEPRTGVEVGRAYRSRYRITSRHHVVVPVSGSTSWMLSCSGGRALREYTGWLETAITCPACLKQGKQ